MRRIISILSLAMFVAAGLISCNRNDGPQSETVIKITKAYLPGSVQFSRSDTEFLNKCKAWDNKKVLVNSLSDLPKDPLGFSDSYRNINFSTSSLLVCYKMHTWKIESCRNRYV